MNFQDLHKVESAATYLDVSFRAARTKEKPKVFVNPNKEKFVRTLEYDMIKTVQSSLSKNLMNILKNFPSVRELPTFYQELIKNNIDIDQLRKSLAAVKWVNKKLTDFTNKSLTSMKKAENVSAMTNIRKSFYGRVSSIMKQIDSDLSFIDKARIEMKRFPAVKTSLYSVAIAGYPNVGKSSLLKTLTGSKPEIKDYAFTTKSLNMGYFTVDKTKIQIIDTPGMFDRKEPNAIEKLSLLVLNHVADLVIFLVDATETCGYDMEKQLNLLETVKKIMPNMIVLYNKADLLENRDDKLTYISSKSLEGIPKLKILIKEHETKSQKKDNKD